MQQTTPKNVDEYIAAVPGHVQNILEAIRMTIHEVAPNAQEIIRYTMPTFVLNGSTLVHVAAFKHHIGLYPAPIGDAEFENDLARYASGKGTVQFRFDQPLPLDLIRRIVMFRVKQAEQAAQAQQAERP